MRVQLILSYNVIGHKASRDENDQTSRKQRASTLRHMRLTLPIRKSDSKGKKKNRKRSDEYTADGALRVFYFRRVIRDCHQHVVHRHTQLVTAIELSAWLHLMCTEGDDGAPPIFLNNDYNGDASFPQTTKGRKGKKGTIRVDGASALSTSHT